MFAPYNPSTRHVNFNYQYPSEIYSMLIRAGSVLPSWMLIIVLISITACGPSVPGIGTPLEVEGGTVKITNVEKTDELVAPDGSVGQAQPGYTILLIKVETTGTASNLGYSLIDSTGQKYVCGGLYHGSTICQVPQDSSGLKLWYSDKVQIPLASLIGE